MPFPRPFSYAARFGTKPLRVTPRNFKPLPKGQLMLRGARFQRAEPLYSFGDPETTAIRAALRDRQAMYPKRTGFDIERMLAREAGIEIPDIVELTRQDNLRAMRRLETSGEQRWLPGLDPGTSRPMWEEREFGYAPPPAQILRSYADLREQGFPHFVRPRSREMISGSWHESDPSLEATTNRGFANWKVNRQWEDPVTLRRVLTGKQAVDAASEELRSIEKLRRLLWDMGIVDKEWR